MTLNLRDKKGHGFVTIMATVPATNKNIEVFCVVCNVTSLRYLGYKIQSSAKNLHGIDLHTAKVSLLLKSL